MNGTENKPSESVELSELREQYQELRRQNGTLLIALVVASLLFTAFLALNVKRAYTDETALRNQLAQITQASRNEDPAIQAFVAKLADYSRTHPEFAGILSKYKGILEKYTMAPTNSAAPKAAAPKAATPPAALKR